MSRKQAAAAQKKTYRCAVYTRKSSEEGLDQSFNSLDAQREACEAYVTSQSHEGWSVISAHYDDGGYSGGTMDRPAIQRLLQHAGEGRVDIIVVYKVDRLTRSLADFAKIIEILDKHGVSFVSITQQFSTTSSMGRLTLNVLLSFAQFEREVTGERIRDKIAASKKKGMWMGGNPPLGYDIGNRKLELNEKEAERVRAIYRRYLELRTVAALADDCRRRGIESKRWKTAAGKSVGGRPFSRGALYHLLGNRTYLGEVAHRGKIYTGEHAAILPKDLWDKVQAQLSSNRSSAVTTLRSSSGAFLKGLLYDDQGNPMSPSFTKKRNGTRYQYYVSQALLQHRPGAKSSLSRISAPAIESFVIEQIIRHLTDPGRVALEKLPANERSARLKHMLRRVEVAEKEVTMTLLRRDEAAVLRLHLRPTAGNPGADGQGETTTIREPIVLRTWAGKAVIEGPKGQGSQQPRMDYALMRAIARAHRWKDTLLTGSANSLDDLAEQDGCTSQYVRQILKLAFLAPELVETILIGRQPVELRLTTLAQTSLPLSWSEQRRTLGWEARLWPSHRPHHACGDE